ncbi:hypothetical protein HU200_036355 [Digitaria exilis]|uniref:Uncharacterized protein n=1 Tax=Digitaria exilis TaxID=1010633 RepID=A0A835BLK5_9POAL|nr:hypothetical protein HU200_036355 [Digitaria exilis]
MTTRYQSRIHDQEHMIAGRSQRGVAAPASPSRVTRPPPKFSNHRHPRRNRFLGTPPQPKKKIEILRGFASWPKERMEERIPPGRIPLSPCTRSSCMRAGAATLSAWPCPDANYMIAAIVLAAFGHTGAFWTPGNDTWLRATMQPEDVIFFYGAFVFVVARVLAGNRRDLVLATRVDYDIQPREDYARRRPRLRHDAALTRRACIVMYIYDVGVTLTIRGFGTSHWYRIEHSSLSRYRLPYRLVLPAGTNWPTPPTLRPRYLPYRLVLPAGTNWPTPPTLRPRYLPYRLVLPAGTNWPTPPTLRPR